MKVTDAPYYGCAMFRGTRIVLKNPCVQNRYRCKVISRGQYDELRVACRRGSRIIKFDA